MLERKKERETLGLWIAIVSEIQEPSNFRGGQESLAFSRLRGQRVGKVGRGRQTIIYIYIYIYIERERERSLLLLLLSLSLLL